MSRIDIPTPFTMKYYAELLPQDKILRVIQFWHNDQVVWTWNMQGTLRFIEVRDDKFVFEWETEKDTVKHDGSM